MEVRGGSPTHHPTSPQGSVVNTQDSLRASQMLDRSLSPAVPPTSSAETLPFMGSGSLEEALPRPTTQHPDSSLRHQDDRGPGASRLRAQVTALLLITLLSSCLCPHGTCPHAQHRLTNVCPVTKASPAPTTDINMGPAGTGSLQRCHLGCYVDRQGAVPMHTHHTHLQPLNRLRCIWGLP